MKKVLNVALWVLYFVAYLASECIAFFCIEFFTRKS